MRGNKVFIATILAVWLTAQPILAGSAAAARLIPTENSSLVIDGTEISPFQSEMPLPEGKLIQCRGSCMVQGRSMQFVPRDQSVFALAEGSEQYELTVQSGRIDFAIGRDSKGLSFRLPNGTIQSERTVLSATDSGVVRGYVEVTPDGFEIVVQEGALQVATPEGSRLIEPNRPLVIASGSQANPAAAGSAAAGLAAGGAGLAGATGGGISTGAAIAGGAVAAAGIAAGVAASGGSSGGDREEVSPTDMRRSNLSTKPF
jgi:hypothetical protein